VPQSTLSDYLRGRVIARAKSGPKKYLDDEEEEQSASFIIKCAEVGYGYTVIVFVK
jgi:hypothetical protein